MKRTPNIKLFIGLAALALAAGLGGAYYEYSAMKDVGARVEALRKQSHDEKALNQQAEKAAAKLKESSERLVHLEANIPEFAYVPTLLKDLETVGKQSGLDVLGVRPMPKTDSKPADKSQKPDRKPYDEMKIEVKGRGSYRAAFNFVTALKAFPKIVAARTVSIMPKSSTDPGMAGKLDVTVELRTYVFPTPTDSKTAKAGKEVKSSNG